MSKYYSFLLLLLSSPALVLASPFAESKTAPTGLDCKYSEVYSSSQKTFLIFNMIEKIVEKTSLNKMSLVSNPQSFVQNALEDAIKECGLDQKILLSKVEFKQGVLTFEQGAGLHAVEWLSERGSEFVVYKKLYGTYKGEPLLVIKYKNGIKDFTRATGRYGSERSNKRYTFFYDDFSKVAKNTFTHQIELQRKSRFDISSLKSIYGDEETVSDPLIKVGVVGTGLDYNQPGLAKHLAYRKEMEKDLQKLEALEYSLRRSPFLGSLEYQASMTTYQNLKSRTGFPLWMDQVWGTKTPFDSVIIDKKTSLGSTKEHETRVTSRLLRSGGAVEVHFARRSMGSIDDLDVSYVIENFVKKGVSLVNLSFGSTCGRLPKEEKMWEEVFALYSDVVFVVSAGNSGLNTDLTPFCPARFSQIYKNVISVTALDGDGQLAVYYNTPVNFGSGVDLAVKADNLEVLIPYRKILKWDNNANGATSLAAAEVSRILTEAALEGLEWNAQTVKEALVQTGDYSSALIGLNKTSSEVNEVSFKDSLKKNMREDSKEH